jgi:uncharacterized protein
MIIVLDTNVLVSGLKTPLGVCAGILGAFAGGAYEVVISRAILQEYADVLCRPRLTISAEKGAAILSSLKQVGIMVADSSGPLGLPDIDDEVFLAAALAGQADYLVTGNFRHFPQALCRGVKVISPAEFLKLLPT